MNNTNADLPIKILQQRFKSVLIRLPLIVGNEVRNFSLDNFRRQAWLGDTLQPWPMRKKVSKWGKATARPKRALLVDKGRLRRSIRVIQANWELVSVGTDVPYARAHNDGMRLGVIQQVKAHQRTLTKNGIKKVKTLKTRSKITWGRVATGSTTVKAHRRRIDQRIPMRRFLGNSPYLTARLRRVCQAEFMKALK